MPHELTEDDLEQAARELENVYRTGTPVEPLTARWPDLTPDQAYDVQRRQVTRRVAGGAAIKGYKIGLTSVAMQRQLGVSEPDYGCLVTDMFHLSGAPIPGDTLVAPRIEPELAFVLGRELRGPITLAEAVRAVDCVLPALEIVDSRIRDWRITLPDTIADNASSGAVVLGGQPCRLDDLDLALTGCNMAVNGATVATGASGAVLGNPLNALVWLVNAVGQHGVALEPGHVVLSGACTGAVPVQGADVVTAEFRSLGSVTAVFSADSGG